MPNPPLRSILVADDDPDTLELAKTHLEASGYAVSTASTGTEALQKVQAESPALMIIDLMLPELNGWQFVHQMKTDERTRHIPIIMMSALIEAGGEKEELDEADYLLSKPFQGEQLVAKVRDLLKEPSGR